MKIVSILSICSILFSCAIKHTASTTGDSSDSTDKPQDMTITAVIGEKPKTSDPFTISSVSVDGNIMTVEVTYGGGCKDHSFQMIGSSTIAKSMPAIRSIQLSHVSNGDECKKMLIQKLKIDISALAYKQTSGSEIYLALEGWTEKIKYAYK